MIGEQPFLQRGTVPRGAWGEGQALPHTGEAREESLAASLCCELELAGGRVRLGERAGPWAGLAPSAERPLQAGCGMCIHVEMCL